VDDDAIAWQRVALVFRPLPDDVPAGVRFRRLLRFALRTCKLRCIRLEELTDGPRDNEPVATAQSSGD
jgi:hypothetical protein